MKVLITGSSGFIGYHVRKVIETAGHEVRGFDIIANKRMGGNGVNDWMGDVRLLSSVQDAVAGMDAVVHLAAKTGVANSMEWPGLYIGTNIEGTDNVFRAAHEAGIKKVVYASSSSVYGSIYTTEAMRENEAGQGLKSIYAVTKFAQEHIAQVYAGMGMEAIGLRFFSVYGPLGRPDNIVMRAIKCAKDKTRVLTIYGKGRQKRDFTCVSDVADAVLKAVELDVCGWSGVMNVGAGVPISVADVVLEVEKQMEVEARKEFLDARPCDVEKTWADISEAKNVLEWWPCVGIEDGIRAVIESENLQAGT